MAANPAEYIKAKYGIGPETPRPAVLKGVNREVLYKLFSELGYKVGCEIGLEKGKNAQQMFECMADLKLYGVDPYRQHPQCSYIYEAEIRHWNQGYLNRCMHQAISRMRDRNFELLKGFSEDVVREVADGSLDFVYIDGDHSYDMVMLDLLLWPRKVRTGGIVSGHDYYYEKDKAGRRAKVTQAVNDYTRVHGLELFITDEDHYERRGDWYPSWLWVKREEVYPNVVGF